MQITCMLQLQAKSKYNKAPKATILQKQHLLQV